MDFGAPGNEASHAIKNNILADLSHLSLLKISGKDALTFLNGQFTTDLTTVDNGEVSISAWCNPKGQVIANFIIIVLDGEYILLLPHDLKDTFSGKLKIFVLRSEVIIEDLSTTLQCAGYRIPYTGEQLPERVLPGLRGGSSAVQVEGGVVYFSLPVFQNRFFMYGPAEKLKESWSMLMQECTPVASKYWQLFDILDGYPWTGTEISETCLPQFLNMDLLDGLSFSKGCFPGQEVIARLQHRGRNSQRLFIARIDTDEMIPPGEKIYSGDEERRKGIIINTSFHPDEGQVALVSLDIEHDKPEQLRLKNGSAAFLELSFPPYVNNYN